MPQHKVLWFLSAFLPVLLLGSQFPAWSAPNSRDQHQPEQRQSSTKKPSILTDVFKSQFKPEELKALGPSPSLDTLSQSMSPEQKSGATSQLKSLETKTSDPKVLAEISQGYQLLGKHHDMLRVGISIQKLEPRSPRGFSISANAALELKDYEDAVVQAKKALKRNPDDKAAFGALKLSEGRVSESNSSSGSGIPTKKLPDVETDSATEDQDDPLTNQKFSKVAKSVLAQLPGVSKPSLKLSTAEEKSKKKSGFPYAALAVSTAFASVSGLLLFGGLMPKKLDEDYPNLKYGMAGGVVILGGIVATVVVLKTAGTAAIVAAPTVVVHADKVAKTARRTYAKITEIWPKLQSQAGSVFPKTGQTARELTNLPWRTWGQYPKVLSNGNQYAKIGERLYTEHAVTRMMPSGLTFPQGRSISPSFVDDVIRNGAKTTRYVKGVLRTMYRSGTVEVVTEQGGKIVVSVNPFKYSR